MSKGIRSKRLFGQGSLVRSQFRKTVDSPKVSGDAISITGDGVSTWLVGDRIYLDSEAWIVTSKNISTNTAKLKKEVVHG